MSESQESQTVPEQNIPKALTTAAVGEMLGLKANIVRYALANAGVFPHAWRISEHGRWRIPLMDVYAYIDARRVNPADPKTYPRYRSYTMAECAQMLSMSTWSLRQHFHKGRLPGTFHVKLRGSPKTYRIPDRTVHAYGYGRIDELGGLPDVIQVKAP